MLRTRQACAAGEISWNLKGSTYEGEGPKLSPLALCLMRDEMGSIHSVEFESEQEEKVKYKSSSGTSINRLLASQTSGTHRPTGRKTITVRKRNGKKPLG